MSPRTRTPHADVAPGGHEATHADGDAVKIKVSGVTRTFAAGSSNSVHALGPIDLKVRGGEFVCIVGPSGCGKSTLLRMVAGLLPPSQGRVDVRLDKARRTAVAMVFQGYGLYPWKTVEDNVAFGMRIDGVPKREIAQRVEHWLRQLDLQDFATAYPSALSGGMRQRVAVARAFAVQPEILLMDEPFAALDAQLRELMQDELLRLWQAEQRTVMFVTHSLEEAILLGDRVIVMSRRPGHVLASVEVPFERPRSSSLRREPDFNDLRADLWRQLRREIDGQADIDDQ